MMSPRQVRAWFLVHKWSSLICTLFMLLLCITGLPLIFHHEIEHATMPEPQPVAAGTPAPSLESLVDRAQSARPDEQVLYAFFDQEEPLLMVATADSPMAAPDTFYYQYFNLESGEKLPISQPTEGFMYVMLKLHVDLFAGLPGMLFLGVMGLLLLVAIVTGVVLYAPFMRKLNFGVVRADRGRRTRWLDLHNLLGIVTVVWLFVVGFTGAVNTLAVPVERRWQATELVDMAASHKDRPVPQEYVDLDTVRDTLRHHRPGLSIVSVAMPGGPFSSPHHFGVYLVGDSPVTSRLLTPALVDAGNGELSALREMPTYVKALFLSQPLHFGDYGGLPLKIIWAVLDIMTIVVLVTGLYLWARKTRFVRKRRKVEALEGETMA